MKRQKLVLNNPTTPLARNIPDPKLVKTTSAPIGHAAVPKQQLTYANAAAAQQNTKMIPGHHLGYFSTPDPSTVVGEHPLSEGELYFLNRPAYLITGAWDNTEAAEGQAAYLSPSNYKPHMSTGQVGHVKAGTTLIYLGTQRVTEWDGKGWARYVRPLFLVDGVQAVVVGAGMIRSF